MSGLVHPDRIHFRGGVEPEWRDLIGNTVLWIRVLPGLVARYLTHPITGSG